GSGEIDEGAQNPGARQNADHAAVRDDRKRIDFVRLHDVRGVVNGGIGGNRDRVEGHDFPNTLRRIPYAAEIAVTEDPDQAPGAQDWEVTNPMPRHEFGCMGNAIVQMCGDNPSSHTLSNEHDLLLSLTGRSNLFARWHAVARRSSGAPCCLSRIGITHQPRRAGSQGSESMRESASRAQTGSVVHRMHCIPASRIGWLPGE